MLRHMDKAWVMRQGACCIISSVLCGESGNKCFRGGPLSVLTSGAVEVEEAARGEVHPLLALAVVVQGDLLRLHRNGSLQEPVCIP